MEYSTCLENSICRDRQVEDSLGNILFGKAINAALGSMEKLVEYG
jgi:hypothetical protein